MSLFPVSYRKEKDLFDRMSRWGVREEDLEENFVRAQGRGGQKINKTSSCVVLYHRPTKIRIKCQKERSRAMNRFIARRMLLERIEERELGRRSAKRKAIEKIRRQKRKRSKRAKEKMLESKKHRSQVKKMRGRPKENNE